MPGSTQKPYYLLTNDRLSRKASAKLDAELPPWPCLLHAQLTVTPWGAERTRGLSARCQSRNSNFKNLHPVFDLEQP